MLSKKIITEYLDWWTDGLNGLDYSDIDVFCSEHDLNDDEIEELLNLPLFVEEDKI